MEDLGVLLTQIEYTVVIRPHVAGRVGVGRGPLVTVELVAEDLRVEQWCYLDSLLHQFGEVVLEQVATDEVVLVMDHVVHDRADGTDLVVLKGGVNCRSVEVLLDVVGLGYLVLVEDWELSLEVLLVLFS